ncbi:hypothetical protein ACIHFD_59835 [Nonomuraea sp. NPDC051941]|uniref:hypothetical protein n=1 Tax=Nonomuraea sp. NPDC051941 TaxID=3364373 RepID=UPI0037C5367E
MGLERLWTAAWCLHAGDDPAAENWVAAHALAVLAGHADHVAATLDAQAAAACEPIKAFAITPISNSCQPRGLRCEVSDHGFAAWDRWPLQ